MPKEIIPSGELYVLITKNFNIEQPHKASSVKSRVNTAVVNENIMEIYPTKIDLLSAIIKLEDYEEIVKITHIDNQGIAKELSVIVKNGKIGLE